jgi:hypothetical protein
VRRGESHSVVEDGADYDEAAKEEELDKEAADDDLFAHFAHICNGHKTSTYKPY